MEKKKNKQIQQNRKKILQESWKAKEKEKEEANQTKLGNQQWRLEIIGRSFEKGS